MKARRILYVLADMGDFRSSRLAWAKAAQAKGFEVHVAAPGAAGDETLRAAGFTGHEMPRFGVTAGRTNIAALRKIARDVQPDVIHAVTLKYALLTGIAAGGTRARKIYTIAGLGYLFSGGAGLLRKIMRPLLAFVFQRPGTHLIFQNPDDRDVMLKQKIARMENCSLIAGSGVDIDFFRPRESGEDDPPLVVMATRLLRDKGIDVFIEAAKILQVQGVKARFLLAGGAGGHNPRAISEEQMHAILKDSKVEWSGRVADMAGLYARAALVVYPSWYGEGIPRVLLEAAACGKAMVTTNHPGCREAVRDHDNGLLVPVRDAKATAHAIATLLADDTMRRAMGRRSRERAEKEFSSELIAQQIVKIYEF